MPDNVADETKNHYGSFDFMDALLESVKRAPSRSLEFYKRDSVRELADRVVDQVSGTDEQDS